MTTGPRMVQVEAGARSVVYVGPDRWAGAAGAAAGLLRAGASVTVREVYDERGERRTGALARLWPEDAGEVEGPQGGRVLRALAACDRTERGTRELRAFAYGWASGKDGAA